MDKPRIGLSNITGLWRCSGGKGMNGYGETPEAAYNNWNEWRRVYQMENA